jgi:serine/threonine protein kinase
MTLSAGAKLGPYEIVAPLGAGGMGEVYRAKDTRLDRTVAVKILVSHLSASSDLKQRFEREARTVSSLNHPHICQLHDVGSQNATEYLVMEFLDFFLMQLAMPTETDLRGFSNPRLHILMARRGLSRSPVTVALRSSLMRESYNSFSLLGGPREAMVDPLAVPTQSRFCHSRASHTCIRCCGRACFRPFRRSREWKDLL